MSVSEADMMTVLGETQQVISGDNPQTAEYSAAIERQYAYEAEQRADFGTSLGVPVLDAAVGLVTVGALSSLTSFNIGGGGGFTSAASQLEGVQLSQLDQFGRQVGPAEAIPRPGEPTPPRMSLPVPYGGTPFEPVPALGVGAILGGIIAGLLIPDFWSIDREAGPYDTVAGQRNTIPGQGIPQPPIQPGAEDPNVLGPVREADIGPPIPGGYQAPPLPEPTPYDFGDVYDQARKAMEDQLIKDMTTPLPPAPAPAPVPGPSLPPWVWPLIGGLGAIQLGRAGRSRRSDFTLPTGLLDLTVVNEPLLPSESIESRGTTTPGFLSGTQTGGVWDMSSSSENCNCHSRKPGKKRKCLAKAQLSWRSGPKKGRAAGSRCYRFAD